MKIKNLKTIERIFEAYCVSHSEQLPHVRLCVPVEEFDSFKRQVLSTWFEGEPTLIKHNRMSDEERVVATFSSDEPDDIETVCRMLPDGGDYWFDC